MQLYYKEENEPMKKKTVLILFIILAIIAVYYIINFHKNKDTYEFKGNTFSYSENRGKADYEILSRNKNNSLDIYKVKFNSRDFLEEKAEIHGLIFIPEEKKEYPGIVFLPGGGGTKEGRGSLGESIAKLGYAVLIIDQRGIGETKASYLSFEQDYQVFSKRREPMQHLAVYDVLKSSDILRNFKEAEIDKENIAIIGESMGGRYGIIASALDKRIKGIIAISTSGFHIESNPLIPHNNYLISIDPDYYIDKISPNYLIMFYTINDSVVPLKDAQITFAKAKDPKEFLIIEGCQHGYCEKMDKEIEKGLKEIFG